MQEVPVAVEALPLWAQILVALLSTLVTAFVLPWLRHMADAAKARAAQSRIDTSKSLLEQKQLLIARLKSYLLGSASAFADEKFPRLCEKIQAGQLKSSSEVKAELYRWGDELRDQAVDYFRNQGVDIIAAIGEQGLDMLITRAANAVSPFPGKEASVELLKDKVVPMLMAQGVSWARRWYAGDLPQHEVDALPAGIDPSVGSSIFTKSVANSSDTKTDPKSGIEVH